MSIDGIWTSEVHGPFGWESRGIVIFDNGRVYGGDHRQFTSGSYSVSGASGADEDLFLFTPTSLGSNTSGSFAIYFDGSDVGLSGSSSEDVSGTWLDEANGDIYLNTRGNFSVTGLSGDRTDIFVCAPGSTGSSTSCTFSLYWDGTANGYGSENIDGFMVDRP